MSEKHLFTNPALEAYAPYHVLARNSSKSLMDTDFIARQEILRRSQEHIQAQQFNSEVNSFLQAQRKQMQRRAANRRSAQISRARKKTQVEDLKNENTRLQKLVDMLDSQPELVFSITLDGTVTHATDRTINFLHPVWSQGGVSLLPQQKLVTNPAATGSDSSSKSKTDITTRNRNNSSNSKNNSKDTSNNDDAEEMGCDDVEDVDSTDHISSSGMAEFCPSHIREFLSSDSVARLLEIVGKLNTLSSTATDTSSNGDGCLMFASQEMVFNEAVSSLHAATHRKHPRLLKGALRCSKVSRSFQNQQAQQNSSGSKNGANNNENGEKRKLATGAAGSTTSSKKSKSENGVKSEENAIACDDNSDSVQQVENLSTEEWNLTNFKLLTDCVTSIAKLEAEEAAAIAALSAAPETSSSTAAATTTTTTTNTDTTTLSTLAAAAAAENGMGSDTTGETSCSAAAAETSNAHTIPATSEDGATVKGKRSSGSEAAAAAAAVGNENGPTSSAVSTATSLAYSAGLSGDDSAGDACEFVCTIRPDLDYFPKIQQRADVFIFNPAVSK